MDDETRSFQSRADQICNDFEVQWESGTQPRLEDFLSAENKKLGSDLIEQLLKIDISYRRRREEDVQPTAYKKFGEDVFQVARSILASGEDSSQLSLESELSINEVSQATTAPKGLVTKSQMIGPYKLLQKIGEGGMGTVWMAEQAKPVRRRVAIKLIKSELASKEVIARFEAERQALAIMDHPNIARVLDAGTTETGIPYFVMELIRGIPFNQYCDKNELSIRKRLEIMVGVCDAVQHAHQKGILHRDLKPSNILVTEVSEKPVAKVIDFGLAKALEHTNKLTDKTLFTHFGQVVGTLQYMSPEQAEMDSIDIDTRTDIYSLGVILYELLAGSTPLEKETLGKNAMLQILEIIREKDPPRPSARLSSATNNSDEISRRRKIAPSKLQSILKGELDWIVMKAIEKDRARRYGSARDFADDITNYLTGDTVSARPSSTMYRLQKFTRKNKGLVASLSAIALILLAAVGFSSWFAIDAQVSRDNAIAQKKLAVERKSEAIREGRAAEAARDEAERNYRQLEVLNDQLVNSLARSGVQNSNPSEPLLQFSQIAEIQTNRKQSSFANEFRFMSWLGKSAIPVSAIGSRIRSSDSRFQDDHRRYATLGPNDNFIAIYDNRNKSYQFGDFAKCKLIPVPFVVKEFSWQGENRVQVITDLGEIHTIELQIHRITQASEAVRFEKHDYDKSYVINRRNSDFEILVGYKEAAGTAFSRQLKFKHENWVTDCDVNQSGTLVATSGSDRVVRVWDAITGLPIFEIQHQREVNGVSFCKQDNRIITWQGDGLIRKWELPVQKVQYIPVQGGDFKNELSPDSQFLAIGGWFRDRHRQEVPVYRIRSGQFLEHIKIKVESFVNDVKFIDSSHLVVASGDAPIHEQRQGQYLDWTKHKGFISFWDINSGKEFTERIKTGSEAIEISVHKRAGRIIVLTATGSVLFLSPDGKLEASKNLKGTADANFGFKPNQRINFSKNGELAVTVGFGNSVQIWETQKCELKRQFEVIDANGDGKIRAAELSHDAGFLAVAVGNEVHVYDTSSESQEQVLPHSDWVYKCRFSEDDSRLLTTCRDHEARIWNWKQTSPDFVSLMHDDEVFDAKFTQIQENEVVVTTSRDSLAVV